MSDTYTPAWLAIPDGETRRLRYESYNSERVQEIGKIAGKVAVALDELADITFEDKVDCATEGEPYVFQESFPDYLDGKIPVRVPLITRLTVEYAVPDSSRVPRERYRLNLCYGIIGDEAIFSNDYVLSGRLDVAAGLRMGILQGGIVHTVRSRREGAHSRMRPKKATVFEAQYLLDELQRLQKLKEARGGW